MTHRARKDSGFTLIELLLVLAILSILAAIAMMSHRHFTEKAKAVEAEVALAEIDRLETLYHTNHGTYSADFAAIGFALNSSLKYYRVTIQLQNGGASFQATAVPSSGPKAQPALVLTHSRDGIVTQKADVATLSGLEPGTNKPSGTLSMDQGPGAPNVGPEGSTPKANCRQGGEATVAADGLLDMNFCLK
jgi:prepilin-type N-terminal cleavage/methylation domain-containing protein